MRVHQLLSAAAPYDAITREALLFRTRFIAWGWEGVDVAGRIDRHVRRRVRGLEALRPARDDVVLVHHSARTPGLEPLLDSGARVLLHGHGITPPVWSWEDDPATAVACLAGEAQLAAVAGRAAAWSADSAFDGAALRAAGAGEVHVVPYLHDLAAIPPAAGAARPGPPLLLWVGRRVPHKRPDLAIEVVKRLRAGGADDARLVLAGAAGPPVYEARLRAAADALGPGVVTFASRLSEAALERHYRHAHVLLVTSEHEGFCVPLIEAFHHGVPVVARACAAVPETAGDGALLVDPAADASAVAESVGRVLGDPALRASLVARGGERVAAFAPEVVEPLLRAAVEAALGGG